MATRSRVLAVPYFIQPTGTTCQGTVLKMMTAYLEPGGAALELDPKAIKDEINSAPGRPSTAQNAHANFLWWLQKRFPARRFTYKTLVSQSEAIERIVASIDRGNPVLVSVNHSRVAGHIVLVIGYENHQDNACARDFVLVVHDPYGAFDPLLASTLFGQQRTWGGACLISGGESGPGMALRLPVYGASRQLENRFILLYPE